MGRDHEHTVGLLIGDVDDLEVSPLARLPDDYSAVFATAPIFPWSLENLLDLMLLNAMVVDVRLPALLI